MERIDDLLVLFYDPSKKKHRDFAEDLGAIGDDAERLDVKMVRFQADLESKRKSGGGVYGLSHFPAVVYFEGGVPNVYDGDLAAEDVQHWVHEHKTGGHAVKVTGAMLEELKEVS